MARPLQLEPFPESIWRLDPARTLPAFVLEAAGITFSNPKYCINRPYGVHFYTIEYIVSGQGRLTIHGETFHPRAGDVYILPPDTPEFYSSDPDEPWEKLWMNIRGTLPELLVNCYQLQGEVLFQTCPLHHEFESMISIVKSGADDAPERFAEILLRIIARISKHRQERHAVETKNLEAIAMKQYCEEHWRTGVSLQTLASISRRSQTQALRIFKEAFGIPPGEWLQRQRLVFAKQYLKNTEYTVRQIAALIGFKDEFYFANWFKHHAGISPGRFRKSDDVNGQ